MLNDKVEIIMLLNGVVADKDAVIEALKKQIEKQDRHINTLEKELANFLAFEYN